MLLSTLGSPFVTTSCNGGHSPEQIAELCVNRILHISNNAPPEIAQQARAFRAELLAVVLHYVTMAVDEDRATVIAKLERAGMTDMAQQIRGF